MRKSKRALFVCHNHPRCFPGGAEIFAYDLFQALQNNAEWEAFFLARTPPRPGLRRVGTPFVPVEDDPCQALAVTAEYDGFYGSQTDKDFAMLHFRDFLASYQPDLIHFQHTVHLGYDLLRVARQTLPNAPIVYTLHEYLPICLANGQMVKPETFELCDAASPQRCHECFPSHSPQQFFLRERLIKEYFRYVDAFLCPSHFLMSRYRQWGVSTDKLHFLENGRKIQQPAPARTAPRPKRRDRFGFFGQLNPYKGLLVLLEAAAMIPDDEDVQIFIHGGNLAMQSETFQSEFSRLADEAAATVTLRGPYAPDELPKLMSCVDWVVVPSIWWENAPLVIQEAFMHGKPVICSDIGGMAEKVRDGEDGLHFRCGDARDLSDVMLRAANDASLWDRLRKGVPPVFTMQQAIAEHLELYEKLMADRLEPRSPSNQKLRHEGVAR